MLSAANGLRGLHQLTPTQTALIYCSKGKGREHTARSSCAMRCCRIRMLQAKKKPFKPKLDVFGRPLPIRTLLSLPAVPICAVLVVHNGVARSADEPSSGKTRIHRNVHTRPAELGRALAVGPAAPLAPPIRVAYIRSKKARAASRCAPCCEAKQTRAVPQHMARPARVSGQPSKE